MTICREIMTENPKCHQIYASVNLVAKTMRDSDIGTVPIVDSLDGMHLLGIVTDRDLVLKVLAGDKDVHTTPIREVMTSHPFCCKPTDDVDESIKAMEQFQVRRIPVVDDDGRLVGIISQADIATRLNDPMQTAHVVNNISKDRNDDARH